MYDVGTAQEFVVCNEDDVEVAPEHLSAIEGAALPLVGLTGWRALVTKTGDNASRGRNLLITGCVFPVLSPLSPSASYSTSRVCPKLCQGSIYFKDGVPPCRAGASRQRLKSL